MMSAHTSMKVGGPAEEFAMPGGEYELIECIRTCRQNGRPYFLIGNGTNVIVRDGGYRGVVVSTLSALCGISVEPLPDGGTSRAKADDVDRCAEAPNLKTGIVCGAGESLARVCRCAAEHGLTGLEALSGIPGTVGGAVYMNAGAYDCEIAEVLVSARAFDIVDNKTIMLTNCECKFGYRNSVFKTRPLVILSAEFALEPGIRGEIEASMKDFQRRRNEKQPVELPSAGSFFKRPEGDFAGRLIEAAGMKGARVGGAQVSEKHAGFIVNTGDATAGDVLSLAEAVKSKVYEMSGILLEEEPIVIGI